MTPNQENKFSNNSNMDRQSIKKEYIILCIVLVISVAFYSQNKFLQARVDILESEVSALKDFVLRFQIKIDSVEQLEKSLFSQNNVRKKRHVLEQQQLDDKLLDRKENIKNETKNVTALPDHVLIQTSLNISASILNQYCDTIRLKCSPGLEGPPGPPGLKGEPGSQQVGEKEEKGNMGWFGLPGRSGLPGSKGEPGQVGEKGEKGDPGSEVIQGAKGEKGDKGWWGIPGLSGLKGDPGRVGEKGEKGDCGPAVIQGAESEKGDTG